MRATFPSILILCFWLLIAGCDGGTFGKGGITGPDGKPLAGVEVTFTVHDRKQSGTTSDDGLYSFGMTHYPSRDVRSMLTASKPGYKTYRKELRSGDSPIHLDIVLEPETTK